MTDRTRMLNSELLQHISLSKSVNWELAKGYLRAMVAAQGNTSGMMEEWEKLKDEIEGFIRSIENDEMQL